MVGLINRLKPDGSSMVEGGRAMAMVITVINSINKVMVSSTAVQYIQDMVESGGHWHSYAKALISEASQFKRGGIYLSKLKLGFSFEHDRREGVPQVKKNLHVGTAMFFCAAFFTHPL